MRNLGEYGGPVNTEGSKIMAETNRAGIVCDSETYTIRSLTEALNRRESFIREHFIGKGCPYTQVGDLILFSGRSINTWIQHYQGPCDDQTPPAPRKVTKRE